MDQNKSLIGSYITIQGWMLEGLKLSGNELLVFALIYSYCRNGGGVYYGSLSLIERWTNSSKRTAITTLQKLMEKGFIVKRIEKAYGKDNILYDLSPSISPLVKKFHQECENVSLAEVQNFHDGGEEFSPNNILNNIYNNKKEDINNISPSIPQGDVIEEMSQEKILFEEFRKIYLGTKRGLDVEFANFCKKHKDWREVLPYLKVNYERQIEAKKSQRGSIDPRYEKHLQTYINQRCWEEEISYGSNTTNTTSAHGTHGESLQEWADRQPKLVY